MDDDLIRYVIKYFSHLLNEKEKRILHYFNTKAKALDSEVLSSRQIEYLKSKLNISDALIREAEDIDYSVYKQNIVKRLLKEENIVLNTCPTCGALARTPDAKQAKCGHQWQ